MPAGAYRNREFRKKMIKFAPSVELSLQDILFDPQTSGGLLIAVEKDRADELLGRLKARGIEEAAIIGEVIADQGEKIIVE